MLISLFKLNTALMKLWLLQIERAKLVTWEESCFGILLGAVQYIKM